MNLVIENYNKGVQVTWQVYAPEEIAENSSLGMVQLFYYPAEGSGGRYAMVLPGNGSTITSEMKEGGSAASQLHVYKNAGHSIGTGRGTDAEGWLTEAAAFWEEQVR